VGTLEQESGDGVSKTMVALGKVPVSDAANRVINERANFSEERLRELRRTIDAHPNIGDVADMTIYCAGSFGRREASSHSDIDLFFVSSLERKKHSGLNVPTLRMFADIVSVGDKLNFPEFSNDGEFLKVLFLDEMLSNLGSRFDDYENHFTARMLLLLESRPLHGDDVYEKILREAVKTYFRDYPHHPEGFRPTFLINDIMRFWKTLCLNYEHKRNQDEPSKRIKQKIRNFKLKYSRLLTCFATVAKLSSINGSITEDQVVEICKMTPIERLCSTVDDGEGKLADSVRDALESYHWFLSKTNLSTDELERYFADKNNRQEAFGHATEFGNRIYQTLHLIDAGRNNLRFMVV